MSSEPGLFVPPRVDALLRSRRKVEAVKAVLDANPGASLRAAKAAVDARIDALAGVSANPSPADHAAQASGLPAAAIDALQRGQVVEAIKLVRLAYGVDLRTAKQRVEAHLRGDAGDGPGLASAPVAEAVGAAAPLPADVVAVLHAGDRGAAWQLLERKHGATSAQALRRIAEYEAARKRRGFGGGAGATVVRGGDGGRWAPWALLAAVAAAAAGWALR